MATKPGAVGNGNARKACEMALLDPVDNRSVTPRAPQTEGPTKHPMICLAGGFGFIIVAALVVHLVFNALV